MVSLSGKVAFITGSSKGIGKHLAHEILKAGGNVIINGRDAETVKTTLDELHEYNGSVMDIVADVSDTDEFKKAIDAIIKRFGKLDILILNAGLASYGKIEESSDKTLNSVFKVNAFGPFIGARTALPYIKQSKGDIVFISSVAGIYGVPHSAIYSMSKMALTALAQSFRIELNGSGVHVGIIYVGFTKNDPTKMAIGPNGNSRPIQDRPGWIQQDPDKVAKQILRNIKRRKFKSVLSPIGKLTFFLARYFPRLVRFLMVKMLKTAEKLTRE